MEPEQIGIPGISGLLGAILGFLGIRERIKRTENDIQKTKESVVFKDTCAARHEGLEKRMEEGFDYLGKRMEDGFKAVAHEIRKINGR